MSQEFRKRLETLANLAQSPLVAVKPAPGSKQAFIQIAKEHLDAARNGTNGLRVRFNAAAEAAHQFLMAAILAHGYKPSKEKGHRTILFDQAEDLAGVSRKEAAFLRDMHRTRNDSLYDAAPPATPEELEALIRLVEEIEARMSSPDAAASGTSSGKKTS